jgi:hypothetical protein
MIEQIMRFESSEPTLSDVIGLMQKGFAYVEERFNLVEARMDQRFAAINERVNNLAAQLSVLSIDVTRIKSMIADIQEDLTTLSVAFDRDAEKLLHLEQRVEHIEKCVEVA